MADLFSLPAVSDAKKDYVKTRNAVFRGTNCRCFGIFWKAVVQFVRKHSSQGSQFSVISKSQNSPVLNSSHICPGANYIRRWRTFHAILKIFSWFRKRHKKAIKKCFLKSFWLPGWSFHTKLIICPRRNICCSKALFFNVFVAGAICLYFVQNRGRMFHDTVLKNLVSFSTDKYIYLFRNFNRCLNLFGDIKMQLIVWST